MDLPCVFHRNPLAAGSNGALQFADLRGYCKCSLSRCGCQTATLPGASHQTEWLALT